MKLTAQQLRYVMKAAEKGSLTEAAKDLRVSQATLSIAITQVEDHIGFKVFHRGRKGATPTSRGIEFLGYARRAVQGMDLIESKFGNGAETNLDFAVVGQNFGFAQWALGDLAKLPQFSAFSCSYDVEPISVTIRMVSLGSADMGLISMRSATEASILKSVSDSGLRFQKMREFQPHALMPTDHPLAERDLVSPEDLQVYPEYQLGQYFNLSSPDDWPERGPAEIYNGIPVYDAAVAPWDVIKGIAPFKGFASWCNVQPERMNAMEIAAVPIATADSFRFGYIVGKNDVLTPIQEAYIKEIERISRSAR